MSSYSQLFCFFVCLFSSSRSCSEGKLTCTGILVKAWMLWSFRKLRTILAILCQSLRYHGWPHTHSDVSSIPNLVPNINRWAGLTNSFFLISCMLTDHNLQYQEATNDVEEEAYEEEVSEAQEWTSWFFFDFQIEDMIFFFLFFGFALGVFVFLSFLVSHLCLESSFADTLTLISPTF